MLDIPALRRQFPALSQDSSKSSEVRLDNAATTFQPRCVISATADFFERGHAPDAVAARYADARTRVAHAVGASNSACVVFCASATHAIDLVARGWGDSHAGDDDEILISSAEHVANLACWQDLALRRRARLRVIQVAADGTFPLDAFRQALSPRTKMVAVTHVSNVSGAVFPVREIVAAAHAAGARVLIDGAQAVAHMPIEFDAIGADFYAFSGHKAFAPTGIGVLLGTSACLDELQPMLLGANAFNAFTLDSRSLARSPGRFEGGSAHVAGALALAEALEFTLRLGWDQIAQHERHLCAQLDAGLASIEGVSVLASNGSPVGIRSFVAHDRNTFEICRRLQDHSILVRAGHLSAQTLLHQLGANDALRASVAVYNDADDIDRFIAALASSTR